MIFVAGATGYTGRFVVDKLLAAGESVCCLVRPKRSVRGLAQQGVSFVEGDLEQPDSLEGALSGCTGVISVAHIQYAPAVVALCQKSGVKRAVFFSSTRRFSKVKTSNVDVVVTGEEAVETSELDYTLLRPSMIYGPGDDRNISRLYTFANRHRFMPIFGSGMNFVQPVYVEDVAGAAVGALWRAGAVGKVYTLAGPDPLTYGEMIDVLVGLTHRVVFKVHVPLFVALPLVKIGQRLSSKFPVESDQIRRMSEDRSFDIAEAKRELGFVPRSFQKGTQSAMRKWVIS